VNRGGFAGGETIGAARTICVVPEPLLPKVEDIHTVRRAHPQQAGPVAVYRHDAVIAEAVRVASIVLKEREALAPAVEVGEAQAGRDPESVASFREHCVAAP